MQIDPGAYIAELLFENGTVSLPGLGSFVKAYKDANIDYVQGEIKPPSSALDFNENLTVDDGLLVRFLKKKHGIPLSKAEQIIKDYVADVKNRIEKKEFVSFSGLGRLYKDFEGQFKFLPESTNFNTETFGLPNLHFSPVIRSESVTETLPANVPSATEKVSNGIADWFTNNLLWISAAALIVIFTAIYLIVFKNKPQANLPITEVDTERINISPGDSESEFESIDDYYNDEQAPEGGGDRIQEEASVEAFDTPRLSPGEETAIIIIGKFGKKSNVDKLVEKIYEAGFEPYTDKEGKLTVVGIQMIYEQESEVHATLRKVQQQFEPDAEIYKMGN